MLISTGILAAMLRSAPVTLRQLAEAKHIRISTCVAAGQLNDSKFTQVLAEEFSGLEPENELKFEPCQPARDKYAFGPAEAEYAFAHSHGMEMRGHTLVWHRQIPAWARDPGLTSQDLNKILKEHIQSVMRHFRGRIKTWDVVNEAVEDDGKMRSSQWSDKPGIGLAGYAYIAQAFRWAHEADPQAKLFYNDYSVEWIGPKSLAMIAMVKQLKKDGVPISGVGLQCHLDPQYETEGSYESFRNVIRRLKALGLEVQMTEMDVRIKDGSAESLARQAHVYHQMVKAGVEEGVSLIQLWGLTDAHSWIPSTFRGYGWALPWDANYVKKPAYQAIADALQGK